MNKLNELSARLPSGYYLCKVRNNGTLFSNTRGWGIAKLNKRRWQFNALGNSYHVYAEDVFDKIGPRIEDYVIQDLLKSNIDVENINCEVSEKLVSDWLKIVD